MTDADNRPMTETDLLAIHQQEPLAARWFSLASYCLESGCNIVTYERDSFRAEVGDADRAIALAGFFEANVQADGQARWTWAWLADDASRQDHLQQEAGISASWTQVLSDWRERAFAA